MNPISSDNNLKRKGILGKRLDSALRAFVMLGVFAGIGGRCLADDFTSNGVMKLWLDANDTATVTVDTSNQVTAWNDKSGNNYSAVLGTPNASVKLLTDANLNGKSAISFAKAAPGLTISGGIDVTGNRTIFMVYDNKQTDSTNCEIIGTATGQMIDVSQGGVGAVRFRDSSTIDLTTVTRGATLLTASQSDSKITVASANATTVSPSNSKDSTYFSWAMGGTGKNLGIGWSTYSENPRAFTGNLAETLVFNKVLEAQESAVVSTYLSNKYGMKNTAAANTYMWKTGVDSGVWTADASWAYGSKPTGPSTVWFSNPDTATARTIAVDLTGATLTGTATDTWTFDVDGNTTATLSNGEISGAGALTKTGAGTLTLAAANAYSGGTTITAGKLKITNANALGGGAATLNGGTLEIGAGLTVANNIVAAANTSNVIYRDGELTLSGNLSGSGTITTAGTGNNSVRLLGDNSGFSGTFNSSFVNTIFTGANAGSGNATWNLTTGTLSTQSIAENSVIKLGALSGSGKLFNDSTGLNTFEIGGKLTNVADMKTFSGDIQNNYNNAADNRIVAITKVGAGTQTLAGANTYTGKTTVSAGALNITGTASTSEFAIASDAEVIIDTTAGDRDFGNQTISGSGTFTKTGNKELRWGSGKATFAMTGGEIRVEGGTLVGGSNDNEVWTDNKSSLYVANGALFKGVEANVRVDALNGEGTISTGYQDRGSITFGVNNGSGTFSGAVQGSGNDSKGFLIKEGTGTQTLSGTLTYTGTTTVSAGTLSIEGTAKIGAGAITVNGTLALNGTTQTLTNLTGSGTVIGTENLTLDVTGNNTLGYTGSIQIGAATLIKTDTGRLVLGKSGGTSSVIGAYRIQGGFLCLSEVYSAVDKPITLDGGILQRNGEGSGDGGNSTTLANPILVSSNGGGLMAGWNNNLVLTGGISDAAGQTGGTLRIVTDSGAIALQGDGIVNTSAVLEVNSALTISKATQFGGLTGATNFQNDGAMTLNVANEAATEYTGVLSGSGALVKTGEGTQTLSNANLYTGSTTITAGTLIAGSATALGDTSSLTVGEGATFVPHENMTLKGKYLAAGTQDVTLTVAEDPAFGLSVNTLLTGGDLTLADTFAFDISSTPGMETGYFADWEAVSNYLKGADVSLLELTSDLTEGAAIRDTISVDTYRPLFDPASDAFFYALWNPDGGAAGKGAYNLQVGVPEPSTLALLVLGALGIMGLRRRKQ